MEHVYDKTPRGHICRECGAPRASSAGLPCPGPKQSRSGDTIMKIDGDSEPFHKRKK